MPSSLTTIRRATTADIDPALEVMAIAFGGSYARPNVHTLVATAPDGHLFVAERDGRVVATGVSVGFGPTGWIGGIAVLPEARGERLGQALTEAAIAALGERETLLLLASPAGLPIYERLGFQPEGAYRVFTGPPQAAPAAQPGVRAATPDDYAAIRALDALATGEDRALAVDAGLAGALVAEGGFALRPPFPARPIVARDPAAGAALLAAVIEPGLRLAAPVANTPAVAAILAHGAEERPGGVERMRRGAPVAWRPELLWGVFSLFFG
jgi:predicted N-acetyltransferase YhbS